MHIDGLVKKIYKKLAAQHKNQFNTDLLTYVNILVILLKQLESLKFTGSNQDHKKLNQLSYQFEDILGKNIPFKPLPIIKNEKYARMQWNGAFKYLKQLSGSEQFSTVEDSDTDMIAMYVNDFKDHVTLALNIAKNSNNMHDWTDWDTASREEIPDQVYRWLTKDDDLDESRLHESTIQHQLAKRKLTEGKQHIDIKKYSVYWNNLEKHITKRLEAEKSNRFNLGLVAYVEIICNFLRQIEAASEKNNAKNFENRYQELVDFLMKSAPKRKSSLSKHKDNIKYSKMQWDESFKMLFFLHRRFEDIADQLDDFINHLKLGIAIARNSRNIKELANMDTASQDQIPGPVFGWIYRES